MERNRVEFGLLDVSARELEEFSKRFNSLWESEEYRMRAFDIVRAEEYLLRIRKAEKSIRDILKLFAPLITIKKDENISQNN